MSTFSEKINTFVKEIVTDTDTGTGAADRVEVEGVGTVPRDIYKSVKSDPLGDLPRYSIHIVTQHMITIITFVILAATGLPLHFSHVFWAPSVISLFGGPDSARIIHRAAACLMVFGGVYHLATIILGILIKTRTGKFDIKKTQIPRLKDLHDLMHDLKYFMGREPYRPKMEKFMYKQKLHYLAILWGNFVLITAGSMLLFPETASKILPAPSLFQNLARLMHADEAIMAVIIIVFWHWFNVHLAPGRFPLQWTFITGKITREHQIEEHFMEYLNNLKEIPEEREYMKNLLREKGLSSKGGGQ